MNVQIDVINQSTVPPDSLCFNLTQALQMQITRDFYPAWGINANLNFIPKGTMPTQTAWQLILLDNADQAGALGYHDLTAGGYPLMKVFVKTAIADRVPWSSVASHELAEGLVDPDVNLTFFNQFTNTSGRLYAYEACDPVEDDSFGYTIGSFRVSDFIFPSWFEQTTGTIAGRFDFSGVLKEPLSLTSNGYAGIFDVPQPKNGQGWSQINARGEIKPPDPDDSRRGRRFSVRKIPIYQRKRSLI